MMIVIVNYIGDAKIDDWDDDSYVEKKDRNDNSWHEKDDIINEIDDHDNNTSSILT